MAIRDVVIYPDEILRKPNSDITVFDENLKQLSENVKF